jgi:hypothetical protein
VIDSSRWSLSDVHEMLYDRDAAFAGLAVELACADLAEPARCTLADRLFKAEGRFWQFA